MIGGAHRLDASAARKRAGARQVVVIGEGVAVIADHYWIAHSALADVRIVWGTKAPGAKLDTAAI